MLGVSKYRRATSYINSVQLLGYSVGSLLGQLLFSLQLLSYDDAMVLTLALIAVALFAAFLLPMPQRSMFFHRSGEDVPGGPARGGAQDGGAVEAVEEAPEEAALTQTCGEVLLLMVRDFRACFASRQLLYWSLWWVMSACGFLQVANYVQVSCGVEVLDSDL